MKRLKPSAEKFNMWKLILLDNFSYKVVALFISLILWLSILGRRDFVVSKEVEVEFLTQAPYSVSSQSTDRIRIKVSGPQPALKKFKERQQTLTYDITDKKTGMYDIEMQTSKIDLPTGLKVLGVRPQTVRVEVIEVGK